MVRGRGGGGVRTKSECPNFFPPYHPGVGDLGALDNVKHFVSSFFDGFPFSIFTIKVAI